MAKALRRIGSMLIAMGLLGGCSVTDYPVRELSYEVQPHSKAAFLNEVSNFSAAHAMEEKVIAPLSSSLGSTHILLNGSQAQVLIANNAKDTIAPNVFQVVFYKPQFAVSGENSARKLSVSFEKQISTLNGVIAVDIKHYIQEKLTHQEGEANSRPYSAFQ